MTSPPAPLPLACALPGRAGRGSAPAAPSGGRPPPLSSRGLGRRPLTAETRVRIPVAVLSRSPAKRPLFAEVRRASRPSPPAAAHSEHTRVVGEHTSSACRALLGHTPRRLWLPSLRDLCLCVDVLATFVFVYDVRVGVHQHGQRVTELTRDVKLLMPLGELKGSKAVAQVVRPRSPRRCRKPRVCGAFQGADGRCQTLVSPSHGGNPGSNPGSGTSEPPC